MECPDCSMELEEIDLTAKCPVCGFASTIAYIKMIGERNRNLPIVRVKDNYFQQVKKYRKEHEMSYAYMVRYAFELAFDIK